MAAKKIICPICNFDGKGFRASFLPKCTTCPSCKGHFVTKIKKTDYDDKYFEERGKKSFGAKMFSPILNFFLELRIKTITKLISKDGKILDYGAGSGKLVTALQGKGYKVDGYEPSKGARSIALKSNSKLLGKIPKTNNYDLIMFWHSLEHTPNPHSVIMGVKKHLAKNGKLLIAVPNAKSFEAKIAKDKWFHYSYPLHLIHFTPQSIKALLKKNGLKVETVDFFNPEYTLTGLVQTFLNLFLPKDVAYSFLTHRRYSLSREKTFYYSGLSLILTLLFSPILICSYIIGLIFHNTDAIVVVACMS